MKKVLSAFFAIVLMFSVFSFSASAEKKDGELKAGRILANAGEDITIPVSLVNHDGVYIIRVTMKYDANLVELKEVSQTASDKFNYTVNTNSVGQVVVLLDGKDLFNVEGDVNLFDVKFTVKENAVSGVSVFQILCEEGMATRITGSGRDIVPESFSPALYSGTITIMCKEHVFDKDKGELGVQCSKCGAIRDETGNLSVDFLQGVSDINIATEVPVIEPTHFSGQNQDQNPPEINKKEKNKTDNGGISFWYFVPLIAAVLIAAVVVFIILKKRKSTAD